MTAPNEESLRRALDDVLTICWADDIPILDAIAESIEDWTALTAAEFYESRHFDIDSGSSRLAAAVSTLTQATGSSSIDGSFSEALADWISDFGR